MSYNLYNATPVGMYKIIDFGTRRSKQNNFLINPDVS
jgi:hypothetical protein